MMSISMDFLIHNIETGHWDEWIANGRLGTPNEFIGLFQMPITANLPHLCFDAYKGDMNAYQAAQKKLTPGARIRINQLWKGYSASLDGGPRANHPLMSRACLIAMLKSYRKGMGE